MRHQPQLLIETLEGRTMMSADLPPAQSPLDAPGAQALHMPAAAAAVANIKGTYTGTANLGPMGNIAMQLKVTKLTGTKVEGTLTSGQYPPSKFTGVLNGSKLTGTFTFVGGSASLSGTLTKANSRLAGTLTLHLGPQTLPAAFVVNRK